MRIRSFDSEEGILYLVATPIGNLEDFTFRAINTLKSVDKIYAEDTRTSKVLLDYYNITTHLESYHEFNQELKEEKIIEELKSGMKLALISDAGLPVISDPGYKIVSAALKEGLRVSTIPGASAGVSALIKSGLTPMPYLFYGFLDSKESKRKEELNELKYNTATLIFYEAPHRTNKTLSDIYEVLGNRYVVIERELTKKFEEHIEDYVGNLLDIDIKGEIVLLVSGYKEEKMDSDPFKEIDNLVSLGYKSNDAIKEVSKMLNLDKKELYKKYIDYKKER